MLIILSCSTFWHIFVSVCLCDHSSQRHQPHLLQAAHLTLMKRPNVRLVLHALRSLCNDYYVPMQSLLIKRIAMIDQQFLSHASLFLFIIIFKLSHLITIIFSFLSSSQLFHKTPMSLLCCVQFTIVDQSFNQIS
jgi:hypothetical protein